MNIDKMVPVVVVATLLAIVFAVMCAPVSAATGAEIE